MYSYFFVFSCLFAPSVFTLPSSRLHRLDYTYNPKTDAYYKLHLDPKLISEAEAVCKAEGAHLMIPSSKKDIHQIFVLIMKNRVRSAVWIGKKERNMECHVITRDMDISAVECTEELPFACKVTAAELNHDKECKDHGYRYYPETGSCYRVPPYATSWYKALDDCQKENAHLLVLNSDEEAKTIKEFLKTVPRVPYAINDLYFYAGFRAERPSRDFRTIFGKSLEENGYVGWSEYEPNNWLGMEYCGSVTRETGMNNDIVCYWDFGFICEKELSPPEGTIDTANKSDITPTDKIATRASESNDVNLKMATQFSGTNDLSSKVTTQASHINDLSPKMTIQASETIDLSEKELSPSESKIGTANKPDISIKNNLVTVTPTDDIIITRMATQDSDINTLIPKMTTQAPDTNDLRPKMATQASETNDRSPKMATQASETNDRSPNMATQDSETNDFSPKMATQASETNDLVQTSKQKFQKRIPFFVRF